MPSIVVVTGPPGAGKSAVAAALVEAFDPGALVEGDAFFAFLRRGTIPPWLPAAHEQNEGVLRAAAAATGRLAERCTVVYEGVVGAWFLPTFAAAAGVGRLHYAVLLPPEEVCLARVATRAGHGFTDLDATRRMYGEFARARSVVRHVVEAPPDEDARSVADRVLARVRDGSLPGRTDDAGRAAPADELSAGRRTAPPRRAGRPRARRGPRHGRRQRRRRCA